MTDDRAVNTVADVSLAVVLVTAAIALVAAAPGKQPPSDERLTSERTGEVLSTATIAVPYSLGPVVAETSSADRYDDDELHRVSHGSVADLVADAAIADLSVAEGRTLTPAGRVYETAIEDRFQARLVGSNVETNVTALWKPYEDADIGGSATVGQPVPPAKAYSSTHLTVPSGFGPARADARAAVDHADDYESVGAVLARTLVDGYLPPVASERALEEGGLERDLTVFRYEQMATLVERTAPDDRVLRRNLPAESADSDRLNGYLATHLAEQIAADLASEYDTAQAAAAAVSTAEVTVIVRTWEP